MKKKNKVNLILLHYLIKKNFMVTKIIHKINLYYIICSKELNLYIHSVFLSFNADILKIAGNK